MPIFALFLADMIDALSKLDVLKTGLTFSFTEDEIVKDVNRVTLYFLIMAVVAFITNFVQLNLFTNLGEYVTFNLRKNSSAH